MKKISFSLSILLLVFCVNAQNVLFNSINIPFQCYSPHYVNQSNEEITINGKAGYYIFIKDVQINYGNLQVFNLHSTPISGLLYMVTTGGKKLYLITSNSAKIDVHFEILQEDIIPGYYLSLKFLYEMGSSYNDRQNFNDEKTILSTVSISNVMINGPDNICSANSLYNLQNRPSGSIVTWTWSSNLTYISGQGTNTLTVKGIMGSGGGETKTSEVIPNNDYGSSGWVKANIVGSCYNIDLQQKNIWVGKPGFTPVVTGSSNILCSRYTYFEEDYRSVTWSVYGPFQIIGPNYGHKCTILGTENGIGWIYATASNTCGSFRGELLVEVNCNYYIVSPNPTSSSISVSKKQENVKLSETIENIQNSIKSIAIYDKSGILLYSQKFESEIFETDINISNFPVGVYLLKINTGDCLETHIIIKD